MISKAKRLELTQAFRMLVDMASKESIDLHAAVVVSVDESDRTCSVVLDDDEMELEGVRLQTVGGDLVKGGLCLIPKAGSQVTIAREDGALETVFVIATSELEKILIEIGNSSLEIDEKGFVFNKGKKGGVPITPKLVKRLNDIENRLTKIEAQYSAHTHSVTAVGAPTGPVLPTFVPEPAIPTIDSDIENQNIKQ